MGEKASEKHCAKVNNDKFNKEKGKYLRTQGESRDFCYYQ